MNLITKYIDRVILVLSIISVAAGFWYFQTHSIVSNKDLKKKNDSIIDLKIAVIEKDSLLFSLQQTVDLNAKLTQERQIVLSDLNRQLTEAKSELKQANDYISHLEENNLIRYFKKDFLSKCYEEIFKKPDCIKKESDNKLKMTLH